LVSVNRNTVNRFYFVLRTIVAEEMEKAATLALKSGVGGSRRKEVSESSRKSRGSYFDGRRKDKRGREVEELQERCRRSVCLSAVGVSTSSLYRTRRQRRSCPSLSP